MRVAVLRMASSGPSGSRNRRSHGSMCASMTIAVSGSDTFLENGSQAHGAFGLEYLGGVFAAEGD